MAAMDIGDIVHLSDIKVPEGVQLSILAQEGDADPAVISIHVARAEEAEEEIEVDAEASGDESEAEGEADSEGGDS